MASVSNCNPCCSTTTTTQIPGPAGADATVLTPLAGMTPEAIQVGTPGQTILCLGDESWWVKKTGTGTTGWIRLVGGAAILLFFFLTTSASFGQSLYRNYFTTNTSPFLLLETTNAAKSAIALDVTKMPASAQLTNASIGNGSFLASNVPITSISNVKYSFTGIVTNAGLGVTNWLCITNGVVCTNKFQP